MFGCSERLYPTYDSGIGSGSGFGVSDFVQAVIDMIIAIAKNICFIILNLN